MTRDGRYDARSRVSQLVGSTNNGDPSLEYLLAGIDSDVDSDITPQSPEAPTRHYIREKKKDEK